MKWLWYYANYTISLLCSYFISLSKFSNHIPGSFSFLMTPNLDQHIFIFYVILSSKNKTKTNKKYKQKPKKKNKRIKPKKQNYSNPWRKNHECQPSSLIFWLFQATSKLPFHWDGIVVLYIPCMPFVLSLKFRS